MELAYSMDAAWTQYSLLEKRLMDYFFYVPPVSDHFGIWSEELGEILILTGTGLESFLEAGLECEEFIEFPPAESAYNKKHNPDPDVYPTVGDLREAYEGFYAISGQFVFLLKSETVWETIDPKDRTSRSLQPEYFPLYPFTNWKFTEEHPTGKAPEWWNSYNAIKHRGLIERKQATLKMVIMALAAYFMILAVHLCSIPTLIRFGVIHQALGGNVSPPEIHRVLVRQRVKNARGRIKLTPLENNELYIAETPLFAYAYPLNPDKFMGWMGRPFNYVGPTKRYR